MFFHLVLKGWEGAAADGDRQVTLNGLVAYATSKTQTFARVNLDALQSPQLKSDFEGTWVLRKLNSSEPTRPNLPRVPPVIPPSGTNDSAERNVEVANSIGMKLRLIPKGEFTMGLPESEEKRDKDETQHTVRITKAFYLGKYEVTQGEFRKVMGRNPSNFSASGDGKAKVSGLDTDRCLVERVSWYDAVEFCNKLSESESLPAYYRMASIERN